MVEVDRVVRQRLAGPVGEVPAAVAMHDVWQGSAGRLQMALEAHLPLSLDLKARGVGDRRCHGIGVGLGTSRGLDVRRSRTVATLAVDAVRDLAGEDGPPARPVASGGHIGVPVVAEHAVVGDHPLEAVMVRPVVPRAHSPDSAVLRVPSQRKLNQLSGRGHVYEASRMVARAHHEVDLLLKYVLLTSG